MSPSRIQELARIISEGTTDIDCKLQSAQLPTPSFDPAYANDNILLRNIADSRSTILEATDELHSLMLGPAGQLTSQSPEIFLTLQFIARFKIANSFPNGAEEASYDEIAHKAGCSSGLLQRILRHAMTYHIFSEPRDGFVAHTAASKYLVNEPTMQDWLGLVTEEMWPAASKVTEAVSRWPNSEEPTHSGFNIAHGTSASAFQKMNNDVSRQARYTNAMRYFGSLPSLSALHTIEGFPWTKIRRGTVVDVGGGDGSTSLALAREFPNLSFVVQDQDGVARVGRAQWPVELQERVRFMTHDFFDQQPVEGAGVYILRWILHDWSDKYAIKILKALCPAMREGARLCICEIVLPAPKDGAGVMQERGLRSMDLAMLGFHNARERGEEDWVNLLKMADERFHIVEARQPVGSMLAMIEVVWRQGSE